MIGADPTLCHASPVWVPIEKGARSRLASGEIGFRMLDQRIVIGCGIAMH